MTAPTVLVVDDDAAILTVLKTALVRADFQVRTAETAEALERWSAEGVGDVLVMDVILPDENTFNLLPRIRQRRPDLPVIVMSAQNTILTAIRATEFGAYEYLPKPFDLDELVDVVRRALTPQPDGARLAAVHPETESLPLIGRSAPMQEIYRVIARLMNTDLTVMIEGESGTGKELVARALHDYGRRRTGPFVAVNMAAIPRDLIETELFGHERGSFTGATARTIGRFEQARGGTLFLDEIGDMPMDAQTRLLRVLQDGEFTTVGGQKTSKTDVRIIAATHRDLPNMIARGQFREDLFYRLNVVPLRLPPLRERREDIPDLIAHFLSRAEHEGLGAKTFAEAAVKRLETEDWPGNVRELENFVRRLVAICAGDVITVDLVEEHLRPAREGTDAMSSPLSESIARHIDTHFARYSGDLPPPGLYERVLSEFEKPLLTRCLKATRGNQVRAAQVLGLNRNTLRKKLRQLQIDPHRSSDANTQH